jgi:F0F1-type ATP synthase membrane subunit c/vacuolar-type H+-ATPase subunit K
VKKQFKRIAGVFMAALMVLALAVPALCAELGGESDVTAVMTEGLNTMKTDTMNILLIALPVALGIFAVFFGIRKGIALLRGVAK